MALVAGVSESEELGKLQALSSRSPSPSPSPDGAWALFERHGPMVWAKSFFKGAQNYGLLF